jgi:hypothetical protein
MALALLELEEGNDFLLLETRVEALVRRDCIEDTLSWVVSHDTVLANGGVSTTSNIGMLYSPSDNNALPFSKRGR